MRSSNRYVDTFGEALDKPCEEPWAIVDLVGKRVILELFPFAIGCETS